MGRPAARADPQSFDRFAVDYDRYVSLEPPLVLDWLLHHLPTWRWPCTTSVGWWPAGAP